MLSLFRFVTIFRTTPRCYSQSTSRNPGQTSLPPTQTPMKGNINIDVSGLSSAVIHPANEPLGPGVDPNKSGPYKVPEYFCYDNVSYFEAEIEMAKYRLPQPSSLNK